MDADTGAGHPGQPVVVAVPPLLDGVRVDRAVSLLTGVSRSMAAQLVAGGQVAIDGEAVTTRSTSLRAGTTLAVVLATAGATALVAEPQVAVPVVYADEHVVVVDKPPGLVVHPGAGQRQGTMVAGLLARFPDLGDLAADQVSAPDRPGIVHRIDKGTSGLLMVARTPEAVRALSAQLEARSVERRYLALVAGPVADLRGVVDAPIGRSARTPTRMAVSASGRPARTRYDVLEHTAAGETLLACTLDTGRTHQIRVHLAAIGHPVVGDDRYGPAGGDPDLGPGRQFLHAAVLGFAHPADGSPRRFESDLPADLAARLAASKRPT